MTERTIGEEGEREKDGGRKKTEVKIEEKQREVEKERNPE